DPSAVARRGIAGRAQSAAPAHARLRAAAGARGSPSDPLASARPPGVLCFAASFRIAAAASVVLFRPVSPAGFGASRLARWGSPARSARSPRMGTTGDAGAPRGDENAGGRHGIDSTGGL